jgi:hypothetical protein
MSPFESWHASLNPPPGGLERLMRAIDTQRKPEAARWPRFVIAAAFGVVLIGIGVINRPAQNAMQLRLKDAVQTALTTKIDTQVYVKNGAGLELPSSTPNVRIVWIAQLTQPSATGVDSNEAAHRDD